MQTLTLQRAKQILGDRAVGLSDGEIQAKIDIIMVLANRCYNLIDGKKAKTNTYDTDGREPPVASCNTDSC